MQPIDSSLYTHKRYEDNTIVRVDGLGGETPELTQAEYDAQLAFYKQVIANLEAQNEKLEEFEEANPPFEIEEPTEETVDGE